MSIAQEVADLEAREAAAWERLQKEATSRGWNRHLGAIAREVGHDLGPNVATLTVTTYVRYGGYDAMRILDAGHPGDYRDRLPAYRASEQPQIVDLVIGCYIADVKIPREGDSCTCETITAQDMEVALTQMGVTNFWRGKTIKSGGGCRFCA